MVVWKGFRKLSVVDGGVEEDKEVAFSEKENAFEEKLPLFEEGNGEVVEHGFEDTVGVEELLEDGGIHPFSLFIKKNVLNNYNDL